MTTAEGTPTMEQIMQHIESLRQENEAIRKQAESDRIQWHEEKQRCRAETEAELRKESEESRQRLEESLCLQELLRKSNEELRTRMRDRGSLGERHTSVRRNLELEEGHPLGKKSWKKSYLLISSFQRSHHSRVRTTQKPTLKLSEHRCLSPEETMQFGVRCSSKPSRVPL